MRKLQQPTATVTEKDSRSVIGFGSLMDFQGMLNFFSIYGLNEREDLFKRGILHANTSKKDTLSGANRAFG